LTHDLLKDLLLAVGSNLEQVEISEIKDGVFYATLKLANGVELSARPSDAIALALRTGSPIFGGEALLDEVGIEIADQSDDEVEKFREFLDQIEPEDFVG
ncbi:MAG: bifunctional nuclease family protein, partial [Actinobacteria bacterium]|nr:bifunctional nuclease family protein [Actinomycetota bacterium]